MSTIARRVLPAGASGTGRSSLRVIETGSVSSGTLPSGERTGETALKGWPEGTDQASLRTRAARLRPSRELTRATVLAEAQVIRAAWRPSHA